MSNPDTISGFRVEASTNCSKQIAGLKFANSFTLLKIQEEKNIFAILLIDII